MSTPPEEAAAPRMTMLAPAALANVQRLSYRARMTMLAPRDERREPSPDEARR